MDTWATSSLSPLIVCGWERDPDLFARTFPMDMRPQAHEIIRTWLFATVVRAHYEVGTLPWRTAAISGIVADPKREKMSKSKGNVVDPLAILEHLRPGRGALAGGRCPAGHRQPVRRGADEDRPPAGHQDPQRQQVRPADRRGRGPGARSPTRWTSRCSRPWPASCARRPRRWTPTSTPGRSRSPRRSSGPSATTTSSWSRTGRTAAAATAAADVGEGHPGRGAVGPAAAVRAVPAVRHRGGLVLVAGGLGAPGRLAGGRRGGGLRRGRPTPACCATSSVVLAGVRKAKSEAKTSMRTEVARGDGQRPAGRLDRVGRAAERPRRATGRVALELASSPFRSRLGLHASPRQACGRWRSSVETSAAALDRRDTPMRTLARCERGPEPLGGRPSAVRRTSRGAPASGSRAAPASG